MPRGNLLDRLASGPKKHIDQFNVELKKALSPTALSLLRAIGKEASLLGDPLYIVGGFVRDILLGQPNLDLDLVIEGDAIHLGRALVKRMGGRLTVHKTFGTAIWWPPLKKNNTESPEFFDLISARSETYRRPGALPDVRFASIQADQLRRDFTINTLALRLNGARVVQFLDPANGLADLRLKLLRTLHPRSFSDDPTRILRILRIAGRLNFKIEKVTQEQLKTFLGLVHEISGERIRKELEFTFEEDRLELILRSMQRLGVLRAIHPALRFSSKLSNIRAFIRSNPPDYWELDNVVHAQIGFVLWFMHFPPKVAAQLSERLRFPAELRAAVLAAAHLRLISNRLKEFDPSKIVAVLEKEPMLAVYALFLINKTNSLGKRLDRYARQWRHVQPMVDGRALRSMGLSPGPIYRQILSELRAAWMDGKVRTKKQEQTLVESLVSEYRRRN